MPDDSIEWTEDEILFPLDAPASFRGRLIRVGWHPGLKRVLVQFDGISPSAHDIAWAEEYIAAIADRVGIDPSTAVRVPFQGRN